MGNLTGKVFLVEHEQKKAHVEIEAEGIPFDAYCMFYDDANFHLEEGDIVETTAIKKDDSGQYVDFVRIVKKYEKPEWPYEDKELVAGKFHNGEMHPDQFEILHYEYYKEEAFNFFCRIRAIFTGEEYDAIAPKEKGQPFDIVTY